MNRSTLRDTALIAVFAALIAALSIAPAIPIGVGVPLTLQTLAVGLAGAILGWWRGGLAVLLYLVVGLAGLPVFAQGNAGLAVITMPSAGYLLSFPLAAAVIGALSQWALRGQRLLPAKLIAASLVGTALIVHPAGIVGMSLNLHVSLADAFVFDLPFWPLDLLKAALAGGIAAVVHRSFPALLARRVPVSGAVAPAS